MVYFDQNSINGPQKAAECISNGWRSVRIKLVFLAMHEEE